MGTFVTLLYMDFLRGESMKKIFSAIVTLCFVFAMACLIGCSNELLAYDGTSLPEGEIIAEIIPETTIEATTETSIEEDLDGLLINFWNCEWTEEYITTSSGKELRLYYPESVVWPENEVDILAKVLRCEGGTYEEKTRIAQLLSWRRGNEAYPDTIKDIVRLPGYFAYYPEFWNTCTPFEEDYEIAKAALDSTERPEYVHYFFRPFYEEEFEKNEPDVTVYKTENFVFHN